MTSSESKKDVLGLNRSPSPHTKREHVDHLIDRHSIAPPEGAHRHRLRLLHGAAHQDRMGRQGDHLHRGDIAMVIVDEEGNLRAAPLGPLRPPNLSPGVQSPSPSVETLEAHLAENAGRGRPLRNRNE
jgi:hypothetical protein